MAAASFVVSLYLRLDDILLAFIPLDRLVVWTLLFTALCGAAFWSQGMYRSIWRYASLRDLMTITRSVSLAILLFLGLMFLWTRLEGLPRSALLINWFVLLFMLGAPRFLYRLMKDGLIGVFADDGNRRVPVLLVGAGDGADLFIRDARRENAPYRVVGMLAFKQGRIGRDIQGVRVLGSVDDLRSAVARLEAQGRKPQRVILTRPPATREQLKALFDECDGLGITLSRLPELSALKQGMADKLEVRPIAIEDLLGRPQAVLDRPAMQALVKGRRVLVTGAGGSIGSELVRQVAALEPAEVVLVESSEFALYTIDGEMRERFAAIPCRPLIADVRDRRRIDEVFAAHRPELVFHAAALKHVPMVEANPVEGVLTNVAGTRIVADAACAHGVDLMVLISTDKAVNPTNVMGATKRIAERYCQTLDSRATGPGTQFVTVRFGNVLGSTGSVVPLFRRQLENGGPLTVTHPDMTRYFMTIREAVELVLQASAYGHHQPEYRGRIFVLDMGDPVKIVDLARQMIRLAGLRPEEDVKIVFTGLRPGEKLFEEIFHGAEPPVPTGRQGILLAQVRGGDAPEVAAAIDALEAAARAGDAAAVLAGVRALVPEYAPSDAAPAAAPPPPSSASADAAAPAARAAG
ncbi:polysaccharide biosynthesis protein [Caenispirillum bisanense]|uniref:polysaccharide biosynthesis protein n=1 Tax=Caenispirillum bisanense TaxID=414052 RepID=UPI003CD0800D